MWLKWISYSQVKSQINELKVGNSSKFTGSQGAEVREETNATWIPAAQPEHVSANPLQWD